MAVLKKRFNNYEYLGILISPRVHSYLAFYSIAKCTTKTEIVTPLLNEWITKTQEEVSDVELVKEIISRVNMQWKIEQAAKTKITFSEFKDSVSEELLRKGVPKEYVKEILKEIKDAEGG